MTKRYMLKIKHGNELIYETNMFGGDYEPDEEFYKNLKLDEKIASEKTNIIEVNLKHLLLEWWKLIIRTLGKEDLTKYIEYILNLSDNNTLYDELVSQKHSIMGLYFEDLNYLMEYAEPNNYDIFMRPYKAYVVID